MSDDAIRTALHSGSPKVAALLNQLRPRERRVIQLRYGLIDGEERTLDTVAGRFGLSRERIRQIEAQAIRSLVLGGLLDP